jgi:hypothetical protein
LAVLALALAWVLLLIGCATPAKPAKVACDADITWQIGPEAQITRFYCEAGKYKRNPALIFTVGVKNVGEKPARYRVNIFLLDMDKAAGHLIPRKGKPPVLEPGKAGTIRIPFLKTAELSRKILVEVKRARD